jgi:hypothetical protein
MKQTFVIIADTSLYTKQLLTVEKYVFDLNNEDDREALEQYLDEGEELNEESFSKLCMRCLQEEEQADWDNRGVPSIILTEQQFNLLKTT